ncbi:MAG: LysR family transcriptional regulator [Pseudomonadota bacterium]
MEMYQVRYVLAAAEHLNFTRAAAQCAVSQPALTKGIKALERELNAPLFHREGRRILVSQFGKMMLPHLRQIAAEADAAHALATSYHQQTDLPVRLGIQSTIAPAEFDGLFRAFMESHSGAKLATTVGPIDDLVHALQGDAIDLAIVSQQAGLTERLALIPLYTEAFVVVTAPGHPLAERASVSVADLEDVGFIDRVHCEQRAHLMSVAAAQGVRIVPRYIADRDDWVQEIISSGLGVTVLPERSVSSASLVRLPLTDPAMSRTVGLASVPGRSPAPGASALAQLCQEYTWTQ